MLLTHRTSANYLLHALLPVYIQTSFCVAQPKTNLPRIKIVKLIPTSTESKLVPTDGLTTLLDFLSTNARIEASRAGILEGLGSLSSAAFPTLTLGINDTHKLISGLNQLKNRKNNCRPWAHCPHNLAEINKFLLGYFLLDISVLLC